MNVVDSLSRAHPRSRKAPQRRGIMTSVVLPPRTLAPFSPGTIVRSLRVRLRASTTRVNGSALRSVLFGSARDGARSSVDPLIGPVRSAGSDPMIVRGSSRITLSLSVSSSRLRLFASSVSLIYGAFKSSRNYRGRKRAAGTKRGLSARAANEGRPRSLSF